MTESASTAAALNAARKIAVVGSGYMGGGIAQVLALGGARVALADVSAEVAQKNYERLLAESDEFVAAGGAVDRAGRRVQEAPHSGVAGQPC